MLSEFVDKILKVGKAEVIKVDDRNYSTRELHCIKEPETPSFQIHTLTGIKDYFDYNSDDLNFNKMVVIVDNFNMVLVKSALYGDFKQRDNYIVSKQFDNDFRFNSYYDVEDFIIQLQSSFKKTDHLTQILSIIGNLKEEHIKNVNDDGITQTVTAKAGISLAQEVELPNPVTLMPFRTFLEVDQPESKFVFRMKNGPVCGLFEADGGKWKLQAIENIRNWLKEKLPEEVTVIA